MIFMLHTELIPAAEKNSRRLMVMLHGLGDSIEGYRWLPEAMQLPWLNYLLVNAPDDYYGGYSWFDLNDLAPGVQRSRKLLFNLLDNLRAKNFPAEQITLGGFSQGCLLAIEVGLHYPHRLAGIVGISGWVYELRKSIGGAFAHRTSAKNADDARHQRPAGAHRQRAPTDPKN